MGDDHSRGHSSCVVEGETARDSSNTSAAPKAIRGSAPPFAGAMAGMKSGKLVLNKEEMEFSKYRSTEMWIESEEVKVGKKIPLDVSIEDSFAEMKAHIEENAGPRYFVLNNEDSLVLILYMPMSGVKIKEKFLYTQSQAQIKDTDNNARWREYRAEEPDEMTFSDFHAQIRPLSQAERYNAMTYEEQLRHEADQEQAAERATLPSRMTGMASVQCNMDDECTAMLGSLQNCEVVVMRVEAEKGVLTGKKISDVKDVSQFEDQLGEAEPCYVVWKNENGANDLIIWSPDTAPGKLKMKVATYKASILQQLTDFGIKNVCQVEAHDTDDLTEISREGVRGSRGSSLANNNTNENNRGSGGGGGGFKPPRGAFAMPGMGGPMPLPGMGGGMPLPGMAGLRPVKKD